MQNFKHKSMHSLWASLGWDTLRSAVLVSTQIWSGVSWFQWHSVKAVWHGIPGSLHSYQAYQDWHLKSQGAVLQALIPFGGARFIAYHLRCPFLGECRWGPWGIFVLTRHVWTMALYLDHLKQGFVQHSSSQWVIQQIPTQE